MKKRTNVMSLSLIIGVCLLGLIITGCNNVSKTTCDYADSIITIPYDSLSNGNLIDSMKCDYVKLETSDDCFLSGIKKIVKDDSLLFIFDEKGNIFKYDTSGKFLGKIGAKGGATNEYIKPYTMFIDRENDILSVIDFGRLDIVKYNYDSQYLGREKLIQELFSGHTDQIEKENDIYYAYNPNQKNYTTHNFSILNNNNKSIRNDVAYYVLGEENCSFESGRICSTTKGIYGIAPFSDTIYKLTETVTIPAFCINGPLEKCTAKDFENLHPKTFIDVLPEFLKNKKTTGLSQIHITDSIISFEYAFPLHIVITYNYHTMKGAKEEKTRKLSNWIIYSDSECFIGSATIASCREFEDAENDTLKQILALSDDNDNPILAIFH